MSLKPNKDIFLSFTVTLPVESDTSTVNAPLLMLPIQIVQAFIVMWWVLHHGEDVVLQTVAVISSQNRYDNAVFPWQLVNIVLFMCLWLCC